MFLSLNVISVIAKVINEPKGFLIGFWRDAAPNSKFEKKYERGKQG